MKCENCAYFFRTHDEDKYATCQFVALRGEPSWHEVPPCEEDDYYEDEEPYYEEDVEEDIEEARAMMYVDAWKNGDYEGR